MICNESKIIPGLIPKNIVGINNANKILNSLLFKSLTGSKWGEYTP